MKTISLFLLMISPLVLNTTYGQSRPFRSTTYQQKIEIWADSIISKKMADLHVPGVAFALVRGKEIILLKGYGYANLTESIPIDPLKTHFDMGSVPKALVATAILQLAAKGKLSLHESINKWVPYFESDSRFDTQITIHQLLTHSAGLDDMSNIGSASRLANEVPNLEEFIQQNLPIRVTPPGRTSSYSNLGYGILGRIIEKVSVLPFPTYMKKNILDPLQMDHSSFAAKLGTEMESNRALGYEYIEGINQTVPINYQFNAPAAGLRSTAGDMANFLIMQLNNGVFNKINVLDGAQINKMQRQQFTNHPDIKGLGYSLRQETYSGWPVMAQNGGWQGFNHDFYLFKEAKIGIMVCLNGDDNSEIGNALANSFSKEFLPEKKVKERQLQPLDNIEEYAGTFRSNQYSRNSITKIGVLLGFINELKIGIVNDSLDFYGTKLAYEGNDVFRRLDGRGKIAFKRNEKGEIQTMLRDYSHYDANEKIPWYKTSTMNTTYYLIILLVQFIILLVSLVQWVKGYRKKSLDGMRKKYLTIQITSSLIPILFIIGLALEFSAVGPWDFQYGITPTLKTLLFLPFLMIIQLALMTFQFIKSLKSNDKFRYKFWLGFSSVNLLAFLLFLQTWNLIGFNY